MSYFKYLYSCTPTDWFEAFQTTATWLYSSESESEASERLCLFAEACYLAAKYGGWEGDITGKPYISALPDDNDGQPLIFIIFKQSNNGRTFLASPIEFEHLKEFQCFAQAKTENHPEG